MGARAIAKPRAAGRSGLLLDTHIWLWHVHDSPKLSRSLSRRIDRTPGRTWLSPVSLWEVATLHDRGRFEVSSLQAWFERVFDRLPLNDAAFTRDVARLSTTISLPHRDPADRLLCATALAYDLTLMTVDERLTSLPWLPTVSG